MGKFIDLTDTVWHDWTVLRREPNKVYSKGSVVAQWLCRCVCGKLRVKSSSSLHSETNKGCGCKQQQRILEKIIKEDGAILKVIRRYKADSKDTGRVFALTLDQCKTLFGGLCFYCNAVPARISQAISGKIFFYNGIDRVDSTKGYTIDNCVSCCSQCNMMKGTLCQSLFIERCREIARRFGAASG